MSIMSGLHEDLLAEVLKRLPVQLLIKFRRVSKPWRAIIDSKFFANLKLKFDRSVLQARNSGSESLPCSSFNKFIWPADIILDKYAKFRCKFYASDLDSPEKIYETMVELHLPFKPRMSMRIRVNGSCNGLLCLSDSNFGVILWNPCTNKHWKLPFSPVDKVDELGHRISGLKRSFYYAFGYDDISNDYKVVRVVKLLDESKVALHQEIKVYSLQSNAWRSLPLPPQFPYFFACRGFMTGVLVDCSLHWIMADRDHLVDHTPSSSDVIVALDLRTDEYLVIPQPPHNITTPTRWDLGVLDGCLCVLSANGYSIDMWIMKDYRKKDSWAKINLQLPSPIYNCWSRGNFFLYPIGYSKSGTEILLVAKMDFMGCDIVNCWILPFNVEQKEKDLSGVLQEHCVKTLGGHPFLSSLVNPCGGDLSGKSMDTSMTTPLRRSIRLKDREGRKRRILKNL